MLKGQQEKILIKKQAQNRFNSFEKFLKDKIKIKKFCFNMRRYNSDNKFENSEVYSNCNIEEDPE